MYSLLLTIAISVTSILFANDDYQKRFNELTNLKVVNDTFGFFDMKPCIDADQDTLPMTLAKAFFNVDPHEVANKVHQWYLKSIQIWNEAQSLSTAEQMAMPLKIPAIFFQRLKSK